MELSLSQSARPRTLPLRFPLARRLFISARRKTGVIALPLCDLTPAGWVSDAISS